MFYNFIHIVKEKEGRVKKYGDRDSVSADGTHRHGDSSPVKERVVQE